MKWLLLAIWDEFKEFICWRQFSSGAKHSGSAKANNYTNKKKKNATGPGKRADEKWSKPNRIEVAQLIISVVTLAIGLCLARIYYRQMQANLRQATSSELQLREMQKERAIDQRAWVNVFRVAHTDYDHPAIRFEAHFNNTGKTPAINIRAELGVTNDFGSIPSMSQAPNTSTQLLPPGVETEVDISVPISDTDRQDLFSGKRLIFLYGKIWYDDIFGKQLHWTEFCWVMDVKENRMYPALGHNACDAPED